jgi:plastocyanin
MQKSICTTIPPPSSPATTTMHFFQLLALAATATAASVRIDVGKSGLTFTPDSVTAAIGDTLEFYFVGGTHDAVTGSYAAPCTPAATGERFSSGVQVGSASNVSFLFPRRQAINTDAGLAEKCLQGPRQHDRSAVLLLLRRPALRQRHGCCCQSCCWPDRSGPEGCGQGQDGWEAHWRVWRKARDCPVRGFNVGPMREKKD